MPLGVSAGSAEFVFGKDSAEVCADVKTAPIERPLQIFNDRIFVHAAIGAKRKDQSRAESEGPFVHGIQVRRFHSRQSLARYSPTCQAPNFGFFRAANSG